MKSFDPGIFFSLPPGVMPEAGAHEQAEAKRQTTKLNRDIRHLQRRIAESDGRDHDAERLLCERLFPDGLGKPPDHY
jgi:hypothetical protein